MHMMPLVAPSARTPCHPQPHSSAYMFARRMEGASITARCWGVMSSTQLGYSTIPAMVP